MIDHWLAKLDALARADAGPFPYEACRAAQRDHVQFATLVPDLDAYLSELAGYRSWGKRILAWPDEKVEAVRRRLDESFYDRYPTYRDLQTASADRIALHEALERAERTRTILIQLIEQLRR